MIRFLFCFYCVLLPLASFSQIEGTSADGDASEEPELQTRTILKFAPLSLLDIYSSIQFAVEQKVGAKTSLQIEAGYILPIDLNDGRRDANYENMRGLRLRSEFRYYLVLNKMNTGGLYMAPEFLFINLNYDVEEIDKVFFLNGEGAFYYRQTEFDVDKRVFGYHLKIGYQKVFTDGFVLDFYAGLGGRNVIVESGRPIDDGFDIMEDRDEWRLFPIEKEDGNFSRISASLGFKLGFRLK